MTCTAYASFPLHQLRCDEVRQSRYHFHFRHSRARHASPRSRRTGPAEAGARFPEQRHETGGRLERHFSDCVRGDAVFLFANNRRFI